ncbi:PD40 domain-containing protein [Lentzea terrae]|uniref:PD40 domain-containing protein n=1 Tax=Lentzea terrae TaxID=2200761 RepID=UPI000DD3CB62|nr:PD40 domain-containing protein [Lentzea terrae]
MNSRLLITLTAAVLLGGVAVGYTALSGATSEDAAQSVPTGAGPRLMVLSNGKLSTVSRQNPAGSREITEQRCDRVYSAAGTISCLRPVGALKAGELAVLDNQLKELRTVPLTGFPNRTRVSASGRMVAWTLFVDGHSYAANGFSTSTGILDTRTGTLVQSLEEFAVEGMPQRPVDTNYWGVTFTADDNRFYATMSTGGHRYLIEGDFAARRLKPLTDQDNVECPSLSPDGTRIAYKAAVNGDPQQGWRVSVLDLATKQITPLAETRSVDDQPAWVDDKTVAYGIQRDDGLNDVWAVPADGTGTPAILVPEASSPAPIS